MGTDTIELNPVIAHCEQCTKAIKRNDAQLTLHDRWTFCTHRCQRLWLNKPMTRGELANFVAEFKGK